MSQDVPSGASSGALPMCAMAMAWIAAACPLTWPISCAMAAGRSLEKKWWVWN